MNHRLALLVSVVAFLAGLSRLAGQERPGAVQPGRGEGARVQWVETVHDFGRVVASDTVTHEFVVRNTGTAVLEITDVVPACGCTVPGAWDRTIEPGKSGRIAVQFSPANFNGQVTKSIEVTSNDPLQPKHTLEIRAFVWRPLEITPSHIYFSPVEGDEGSETKSVRIVSHVEGPVRLELQRSEGSSPFRAELEEVAAGKEFALRVSYVGPLSGTPQQGAIEIKTSARELPLLTVSVYATPQRAIALLPAEIKIPTVPSWGLYQHAQIVSNNSRIPIALTEATVNADGVTAEIKEVRPGKVFTVTLVFPEGYEPQPGHRLAIKTTHPKFGELTVPIAEAPGARAVSRSIPAPGSR